MPPGKEELPLGAPARTCVRLGAPDPHRVCLGRPGTLLLRPRRTLKVPGRPGTLLLLPGCPGTPLPRPPPPYSASDSSGPRRLRARPDPPLLTINLDFTGRLRVPLRPLAPPLPAFPRDGAGLCQPPPLRSGSLRRVRSSSAPYRSLPSPPLS